jgi:hypothetical protein
VHYFSNPSLLYLFSQLPLPNLLDSKTNIRIDNPQSPQTFVLANTNLQFTTTVSEFSNGTSSVTPSHPLPELPSAAKPQRSLSIYLFVSAKNSQLMFHYVASFFFFFLNCFTVIGTTVVFESNVRRESEHSHQHEQMGKNNQK